MMGHGWQYMAEGGHAMGPWMVSFGLLRLAVLVLFFWLFFRLVSAVERLADEKRE